MKHSTKDRPERGATKLRDARHRYLTAHEAAERCRVSTSTMERLRAAGDGPRFARIGGRVIYDTADIDDWVEGVKRPV